MRAFGTMFIATMMAAGAGTASAQELVRNFDPIAERTRQRSEVFAGRTVVTDYNDALNVAGAVYQCSETSPGSKNFKLKGKPMPVVKDRKFVEGDLTLPRRTRSVVLEKRGTLGGAGAEASAEFRRHIEVSLFESARAEAPEILEGRNLKLANALLRNAGANDGDWGCYVWNVANYTSKLYVDNQQRVRMNTPGVFIVSLQTSFLRQAQNAQNDYFATLMMTPFKIGSTLDIDSDRATIEADSIERATAAEIEEAAKVSDVLLDDLIVKERAIDAGINFSAGVQQKFDALRSEEIGALMPERD